MGHRTLKRVPLDFSWPLNKVWKGYINPHRGPRDCRVCAGTGYNDATRELAETYYDREGLGSRWWYRYGIDPNGLPAEHPPWMIIGECRTWCHNITQDEVEALVKRGRLADFTRVPINESQREFLREHGGGFLPFYNSYMPTADEVNAWSHRGMGHDAANRWILIQTRAKRLGIWGHCRKCKGKGEEKLPRKMKKSYKKWQKYEPPVGEGWQLWETCTEGSPVSPVFATAEELASWCAEYATAFARETFSRAEWLQMFIGGPDEVSDSSMMILEAPAPPPPTEVSVH